MIKIESQSALHQYDSEGNAITTWHEKKCEWIVNEEYENEEIDWYGKDSDFPRGCTLAQFEESNPNWDKLPNIHVTWYWDTKEDAIRAFGRPHTFGQPGTYWDTMSYPYTASRQWGYIDESEETTVERFGKYCDFHKHANRTVVTYNEKILYDGKLD